MDDALKPVLERQMEVYAGFLEHTDHHVGRLIDAIETIGALDNTLVYYIIGDNGASAEGTVNGAFNEMANFNGMAAIETPEFMASMKDELGTADAYNHYAVGWAWAMCTPYQWTKQVASHWGGTRNGTIVHWPAGIAGQGRDPLAVHATSSTSPRPCWRRPGCPSRRSSTACSSRPIEGTSMLYTLRRRRRRRSGTTCSTSRCSATAASTTRAGARSPGTAPRGWPTETLPAFDDDVWELYDGTTDWTPGPRPGREACPTRLAKLQRLWLIEAVKYNVLPIDDRRFERLNATIAGRPQLITGTSQVLFPGMKRLSENSVIDIKNQSFSVTASIETRKDGVDQRGDHRAGRPVRRLGAVRQGRPGASSSTTCSACRSSPSRATEAIPPGSHQVRAEFAYDGGGLAKGGDVTLYYDGRSVGTGRVDLTQPLIFSADETTDIGDDYGMPVSADYAGAEPVQRPDRRGADRRRRRRPDPPHRPGRGRQGRHLPAVDRHSPDGSGQAAAARTTRVSS